MTDELAQEQAKQQAQQYKRHDEDCGSSEFQIALRSAEIRELTTHLQQHKKDFSAIRGLDKKRSRRRKLLAYLKETAPQRYADVVKGLGLRH